MNEKMLCVKCKQRLATIYLQKFQNGQQLTEGYCLKCAVEMNLPNINGILEKMGISPDDIENMSDQISEMFNPDEGFEPGGAQPFAPFMQGLFPMKDDGTVSNKPVPKQDVPKSNGSTNTQKKEQKQLKFLNNFATNLTEKAKNGKIDNLVGREKELERITQILNRRQKNNPCLIGEPGVGKTAIAEGVAQKLANDDVPEKLKGKELYLLDLTALVAGTQFRGQFESRIKGLIEEVKKEGNIILFIDEIHNLIGSGNAEGSMNAANILKPALSRGEIQVIGATTFSEYRKYIEKDAALERRFQPVNVEEPSIEDSINIILGIRKYYEKYHRVKVSYDIAERCVRMSERYITDRFLPDKAIDLLDEACSCAVIANKDLAEYDRLNKIIKTNNEKLEEIELVLHTSFEEVSTLRGEISKLYHESINPPQNEIKQKELLIKSKEELQGKLYEEQANIKSENARFLDLTKKLEPTALDQEITVENLAHVIELWTGIPASKICESELEKVTDLEKVLKERIIGQDEAVEKVATAVKRSRVRINDNARPASFIFVGPTGVGKTELVKQLSAQLFDSTEPLIRVDMSEYMEKHTVSRLVGSPPGYVGYDEAGQLTEKIRRKPYSVVLFDEIEKAHPDVLNILLQILDEGFVTDAQGRKVNFSNTVIVMTSNAGSNINGSALGFDKSDDTLAFDKAMKALRGFLRPEFLGRVDEVVVFKHLDVNSLTKIAKLQLNDLEKALKEKGIEFRYTESTAELIAKLGFDEKSGAREIRRVIRKNIEDKLVDIILSKSVSKISVSNEKEEFVIESL